MLYDVSKPFFPGMEIYPGDPSFESSAYYTIEKDGVNVSKVVMGSHTGTHIDAPYHCFKNAKKLSDYPLDIFMGKAAVVDLSGVGVIGRNDLSKRIDGISILLIKSADDNGHRLKISHDCAKYIAECGIRILGVEGQSVDCEESRLEIHKILLGGDVLIIENLDLSHTPEGEYNISALPLIIADDASPVRVVLRD